MARHVVFATDRWMTGPSVSAGDAQVHPLGSPSVNVAPEGRTGIVWPMLS